MPIRVIPSAGGKHRPVAIMNVLVPRSPEQVWSVLADGWSYSDWVVGTQEIHAVDPEWPKEGAEIHYTVGVGLLSFQDKTTVRINQPHHQLQMEARAGKMGSARIAIEVLPWGEHTVVVIDEHPLTGPGERWHNLAVDGLLRVRNQRMLRNLRDVVVKRYPQ